MPGLTLHQIVSAVRGRRQELGWSQAELARRLRVSRRWVSDFETGTRETSLSAALRALDILDLPIEFVDRPRQTQEPEASDSIDLDHLLSGYDR